MLNREPLYKRSSLPRRPAAGSAVIDTTPSFIKHPLVVADRIERIAAAVGDPHRIIAAPDCGFETAVGSKMVVEEVVWAKLRSLVEGAAIASQRLLGRQ